jgi:capsular polysaccharide biosynthesis protein/Mrp family chromosome partitioning ATPase
MALQPGSEYFDLSDYVGVLRRRWVLIIAFTLIGLVLGGAYYYVTPKAYAATVLVQVNALPSNANQLGGRTGGPVNMDNEAQVVVSATVTNIVRAKLHSSLGVNAMAKQVHVAVPPNTTYLQITCTTSSTDLAKRCANAFGKAYLYNRRVSSLTLINSEIKGLDAEATKLEDSIGKLKAATGKGGLSHSSHQWGVDKLQLTADVAKLASIESKVTAVTPFATSLAVANSPLVGQIVTPAIKPFAPVSPKKKLDLPSGLAAGLVIGLALAYLLEWRRPRLFTARDVQRKVDLPTVFSLTDGKAGAQSVFLPHRSRAGQTFAEAAQYAGAALGDGHHVLIVTAPATESGGTVAANLAAALARTRGDTVLICADPRAVAIPRLHGASDGRGFAELLAGTASLADVTREVADLPHLEVITPGLDAAGAVYDMQHDNVQRIMRDLRREFRYVVIDVPSPGIDADTFSLAEFADAAILTMHAGTARANDINDCLQRLERLRTAVLAGVLLPADGKAGRGGGRSAALVEPYAREPIMRDPVARQPVAREPVAREPVAREPIMHEPVAREPAVGEPQPHASQADLDEPAGQSPHAYSGQSYAPPPRARQADPRLPDGHYAEPLYSDPRPSDPRGAESRHSESRQPQSRHSEPRRSEPRPSEPRPSEPRPSEPRLSEPRPPETRPSEPRPPETRPSETRPSETRVPEGRPMPSFKPHPRNPQVSPASKDEPSSSSKPAVSQPVLRPVAGRRASAQGGSNGGSRHAAANQEQEPGNPSFSSAWRPRNVSETWPLAGSGDTNEDEESGPTDPPSGNLYGRYDRP